MTPGLGHCCWFSRPHNKQYWPIVRRLGRSLLALVGHYTSPNPVGRAPYDDGRACCCRRRCAAAVRLHDRRRIAGAALRPARGPVGERLRPHLPSALAVVRAAQHLDVDVARQLAALSRGERTREGCGAWASTKHIFVIGSFVLSYPLVILLSLSLSLSLSLNHAARTAHRAARSAIAYVRCVSHAVLRPEVPSWFRASYAARHRL